MNFNLDIKYVVINGFEVLDFDGAVFQFLLVYDVSKDEHVIARYLRPGATSWGSGKYLGSSLEDAHQAFYQERRDRFKTFWKFKDLVID